jgi:hypothetical protein
LLVSGFLLALVASQKRLSIGFGAKVALNRTNAMVPVGGHERLKATIAPLQEFSPRVEWFSSDPLVASVDADGLISGNSPGVAFIVASSSEGGRSSICEVNVYPRRSYPLQRPEGGIIITGLGRASPTASVRSSLHPQG